MDQPYNSTCENCGAAHADHYIVNASQEPKYGYGQQVVVQIRVCPKSVYSAIGYEEQKEESAGV